VTYSLEGTPKHANLVTFEADAGCKSKNPKISVHLEEGGQILREVRLNTTRSDTHTALPRF
jgi:hypothetical protein